MNAQPKWGPQAKPIFPRDTFELALAISKSYQNGERTYRDSREYAAGEGPQEVIPYADRRGV